MNGMENSEHESCLLFLEERLQVIEQLLAEETEQRLHAEHVVAELTQANEELELEVLEMHAGRRELLRCNQERRAAILVRDQRIGELESLLKEALIQGAALNKDKAMAEAACEVLSKEKADAEVAYLTEKRLGGERLAPVLEHSALLEEDPSSTKDCPVQTAHGIPCSLCRRFGEQGTVLFLLALLLCILLCASLESRLSVVTAILGGGDVVLLSIVMFSSNSTSTAAKRGSDMELQSAKMLDREKSTVAAEDLNGSTTDSHLQVARGLEKCGAARRSPRHRAAMGGG